MNLNGENISSFQIHVREICTNFIEKYLIKLVKALSIFTNI